ncbi:MAG: hypothetical protein QG670_2883 [Thermoproteota archaeon]|nr:hypothetical protein [Thermoproteota archaeon]
MILESLRRITELACDTAEIVLNILIGSVIGRKEIIIIIIIKKYNMLTSAYHIIYILEKKIFFHSQAYNRKSRVGERN